MDIKGIIVFTRIKKLIFIQKTHQNIFVSIYLLKILHTKKNNPDI